MTSTSAPIHPANLRIPVDLFVSNKHPALPRGLLGFADSSGKIIFRVNPQSSDDKTLLLDSAGNPLISIYRHHTSLMHKLRQIYVGRRKFRLTMFPGSVDPALVVALVVIFLVNGPKKFQVLDKLPVSI